MALSVRPGYNVGFALFRRPLPVEVRRTRADYGTPRSSSAGLDGRLFRRRRTGRRRAL